VWTWLGSDHFNPVEVTTFATPAGTPSPTGGLLIDTFHCNSIDLDPINHNLLISARNMDSIFYVERSSGAVLWKMGGKPSTKDHSSYVNVPDPFFRQHDARFQPGWSPTCRGGTGQISLFDDETDLTAPARAVVYQVVVGDGDAGSGIDDGCRDSAMTDGTAAGAALIWQYRGLANSTSAVSFRISSDGSRVIGWGSNLLPLISFTEVDAQGNDLLDFGYADHENTYRAIKVPLSTFDLDVLRSTAGLP
jgi:hypothetical protein